MGAHYRCWWWWKVRPLPSGGRRGSLLPADGRLRRLVRRGDDYVPVALRSRRRLLSPSPLQQYYHTILVMIMSGKKTLVIQCTCPCNRSRESPAEREKEGGACKRDKHNAVSRNRWESVQNWFHEQIFALGKRNINQNWLYTFPMKEQIINLFNMFWILYDNELYSCVSPYKRKILITLPPRFKNIHRESGRLQQL